MGVSQAAISQYEQGAAQPRAARLVALARILGISPGQLLVEADMAGPPGGLEDIADSGTGEPLEPAAARHLAREILDDVHPTVRAAIAQEVRVRDSAAEAIKGMTAEADESAPAAVNKAINVGGKVGVPWGLDEVPGEVVKLYGEGSGRPQALVRVTLGDVLGEGSRTEEVRYPVEALRPA